MSSTGTAARATALVLTVLAATGWTGQAPQLDPGAIAKGRFDYVTELRVGDTGMDIQSTREIRTDSRDGKELLLIETTSLTGMGETVDRLHLDGQSLRPITREISQGQGLLRLQYGPERVTGLIESAGQIISVNLALDQPAHAGDAGLDTLLVGLELTEGLTGELRIIETGVEVYLQIFNFSVDAIESIEVPAGSFAAWPVRVWASDDPDYRQTIWVSTREPRLLVQASAPVPASAGGGHLITRLVAIDPP